MVGILKNCYENVRVSKNKTKIKNMLKLKLKLTSNLKNIGQKNFNNAELKLTTRKTNCSQTTSRLSHDIV